MSISTIYKSRGMKSLAIGHASEYLVCYDLALRGLHAVPNVFEHCAYDVLAEHNGSMIKIQVKGTAEVRKARTRYEFAMHYNDYTSCDLVALVAIDLKSIRYIRPPTIITKSISISRDEMLHSDNEELLFILNNENIKN
jgi:hypothetical protein